MIKGLGCFPEWSRPITAGAANPHGRLIPSDRRVHSHSHWSDCHPPQLCLIVEPNGCNEITICSPMLHVCPPTPPRPPSLYLSVSLHGGRFYWSYSEILKGKTGKMFESTKNYCKQQLNSWQICVAETIQVSSPIAVLWNRTAGSTKCLSRSKEEKKKHFLY